MKKPIIIDCDPGIDDAVAIVLALSSELLDVKLLTTCAGNQTLEKITSNALNLLSLAGREDIEVAAGASKPLINALYNAGEYHGESGIGTVILEPSKKGVSSLSAVEAMKEVITNSKIPVSIVAIGPLTNIACLISSYPNLLSKIKEISLMGGALQGGNTSPVAEFNIFVDPEAAQIVFNSEIPITMFGLDVTYKAVLLEEDLEEIQLIQNKVSTPIAGMLDYYARNRTTGLPMHDACAVAYLIRPEIFELIPCNVQVETKGEFTYGQTVIDKNNKTGRKENANVAFEVDRKTLTKMIYDSLLSYNAAEKIFN